MKSGCLNEVVESVKTVKKRVYATAFTELWGCRGYCEVGVLLIYRSEIRNL